MAGTRRGRTIVAHLAVFGASILLPVLALFAIVLWLGFATERERIEDEARDGARSVANSVDQRIGALTNILQTLATSPALDRGDLRMFHQQMVSLAHSQDLRLSLRDLNSRQLLNSSVPFGNRLPPINDTGHDVAALDSGTRAVSQLFIGALSKRPVFGVVVPVFHDGVIIHLLGAASAADSITALVRDEVTSPRFLIRVVDQENRILAVIPERPELVGQAAGPVPPEHASWRVGIDGTNIWWVTGHPTQAPWRVDVGVPIGALYGPLWGRLIWLVLGAGMLFGIAALSAVLFGHRIGGAVETIAGAAAALGRGERGQVRPTWIREFDIVLGVLDRSGRERDRREAELITSELRLADAAETLAYLNADLERQVRKRTDEAEVALRELFETQKIESIGQLTGGVAHDFNNLLMAILSTLRPLQRYLPDDPRARRLADAAIEGAERGAALTQRLLTFARRQNLSPTSIDVVPLLRGMGPLFRTSVGTTIDVAFDLDPDTPHVLVDRNQLELAVLNLVINARDAMPGGGTATVAAAPFTAAPGAVKDLAPGEYVVVAVADTGVGMDEVTLTRAVEPFFTTKGVGKGTGLGLSMVHGLAAQSGGAMRIVSAPGQGTTVSLYLQRAVASAAPGPVRRDEPRAVPTAGSRPLVIMVVDDDELVLTGTVDMLEDVGQVAIGCSSAEQALDVLRSGRRIDAVVTDFAMPAMDGAELARLVRERWGVPVILVSGYAEVPRGSELPRLHKPYDVEHLVTMIHRLLASGREPAGTDSRFVS